MKPTMTPAGAPAGETPAPLPTTDPVPPVGPTVPDPGGPLGPDPGAPEIQPPRIPDEPAMPPREPEPMPAPEIRAALSR